MAFATIENISCSTNFRIGSFRECRMLAPEADPRWSSSRPGDEA